MKHPLVIRIAGLAVVAALGASACSSAGASTSGRPLYEPPPPTTAAQPADASPTAPATSSNTEPWAPLDGTQGIDLVTASIEDLGITTVAPQGWGQTYDGRFIGADGTLAFDALPTWAGLDPVDIGYQAPDRVELGGREWQLYTAEAGGMAQLLATTPIGADTYLVWLGVPPQQGDLYRAAVAVPVLEAFDVDAAPPTGDEITRHRATIDGRAIAYATGGSGEPTVVFESGLGDWMIGWSGVAPAVAESAQVFLYDRPGYGGSDPTTTPRDAATMVEELRELLIATGHEPPYVLVGHSLGGTVMDLFARTHPDEVAGLVLVDSRHHTYTARCVAALGEVPDCVGGEPPAGVPNPPHMTAEWRDFPTTEQQLAAAPELEKDLGLVVVTAGIDNEGLSAVGWELWQETQREYAALVPGARHVVAGHSGHLIPQEQPEAVIDAVTGLLGG